MSDHMEQMLDTQIKAMNTTEIETTPLPMPEKRTYSVDDLQQILDVSRSTVYLLIKRKLFRSIKVGKQIRIPKKSFDEWLDRC